VSDSCDAATVVSIASSVTSGMGVNPIRWLILLIACSWCFSSNLCLASSVFLMASNSFCLCDGFRVSTAVCPCPDAKSELCSLASALPYMVCSDTSISVCMPLVTCPNRPLVSWLSPLYKDRELGELRKEVTGSVDLAGALFSAQTSLLDSAKIVSSSLNVSSTIAITASVIMIARG